MTDAFCFSLPVRKVGNDGFPGAVGSACWVGSIPGVVVAFVGRLFVLLVSDDFKRKSGLALIRCWSRYLFMYPRGVRLLDKCVELVGVCWLPGYQTTVHAGLLSLSHFDKRIICSLWRGAWMCFYSRIPGSCRYSYRRHVHFGRG